MGIWIRIVCVYSSSGAMGKVSKPVAAVASVAVGPYRSQCLMSHVWVLSPPVLCPVPLLSKHWHPCVLCKLVTSCPNSVSSVKMYTLVVNTPHFYWCGACRRVILTVSGVWGELCASCSNLPYPRDWSLPVWLSRLSVKIGHKVNPFTLTM